MQTGKWLDTQAGITKTVIKTNAAFYSVNSIAENDTVEIVLDGKLEQV